MVEALAKAEGVQVMVEEETVPDQDSDSESDMDTGIGFGKQVVDKKRKRGKQPPAVEETLPSAASAPVKDKEARKRKCKAGADDEMVAAINAAESAISALESLNPLHVWQGHTKMKDVDKRLSAAYNSQVNLEEHMLTNQSAQDLGKKLGDAALKVSNWMDVITPFIDSDPAVLVRRARSMDDEEVTKFASVLPPACMHSVLVEVARRFLEDTVSP